MAQHYWEWDALKLQAAPCLPSAPACLWALRPMFITRGGYPSAKWLKVLMGGRQMGSIASEFDFMVKTLF